MTSERFPVFYTITHVQTCNLQNITTTFTPHLLVTVKIPFCFLHTERRQSSFLWQTDLFMLCLFLSLSHAVIVPFHHFVFVIRVALTTTLWRADVVSAPRHPLRERGPCPVMWFPGLSGGSVGVGKGKEEKGATGLTHATHGSAVV